MKKVETLKRQDFQQFYVQQQLQASHIALDMKWSTLKNIDVMGKNHLTTQQKLSVRAACAYRAKPSTQTMRIIRELPKRDE
ncbi:CLUMA_CG007064, isoform A [Clunio marinus]|uniref:CLUMA_CG007064, isoform A n=1 Tax=Clunio marinus TaxID=568069 RepID=A0A1J1HZZ1_9DIPT|nr:CLUMA_CG007064, isoform A [Clunio marinus]